MAKSIEGGRFEAEFLGGRFDGAYCECLVSGQPHTVDLWLVAGHSRRDHMADVSLAGIVEAIGGHEFATVAAVRRAAGAGARLAWRQRLGHPATGPRIDMTIEPGTLAARWRRLNIEAAKEAASSCNWTVTGLMHEAFWPKPRDGKTILTFTVRSGGEGGHYLDDCPGRVDISTSDRLDEPDAEWTFERVGWAS